MKRYIPIMIVVGLVIIALWLIGVACSLYKYESTFNPIDAVNTLFAGLAFGGVVIALYIQQQEQKSQGEDIKKLQEHYNELIKIHVISTIFSVTPELTKRSGSGADPDNQKKKIQEDIGPTLMKYYWELKQFLEKEMQR